MACSITVRISVLIRFSRTISPDRACETLIIAAKSKCSIGVRIVSDQVYMTHTHSGQVITGTDAVTEITDFWTFERDLAQANPIWHLVAARSA